MPQTEQVELLFVPRVYHRSYHPHFILANTAVTLYSQAFEFTR